MGALPPVPVVLPILVAAGIAAFGRWLPRRVVEAGSAATAAAVAILCALLLVRSAGHATVYWFGGWRPGGGVALGIDFAIDPIGGGGGNPGGGVANGRRRSCSRPRPCWWRRPSP